MLTYDNINIQWYNHHSGLRYNCHSGLRNREVIKLNKRGVEEWINLINLFKWGFDANLK